MMAGRSHLASGFFNNEKKLTPSRFFGAGKPHSSVMVGYMSRKLTTRSQR